MRNCHQIREIHFHLYPNMTTSSLESFIELPKQNSKINYKFIVINNRYQVFNSQVSSCYTRKYNIPENFTLNISKNVFKNNA